MLLLGVQEFNRKRTNKAKSHCCLIVRTPSPCLPICTLRGVLNAKSVFSLVSAACVDKRHTCNMFSLRQAQWSYLAQNRRYLRKPMARHVSADPATHMATLPCTALRRRGGSTELFNQAKYIRISVVFLKKVIRLPIGFH